VHFVHPWQFHQGRADWLLAQQPSDQRLDGGGDDEGPCDGSI